MSKKRRSKVPPPIRPVGISLRLPGNAPLRLPADLPAGYPLVLKLSTQQLLVKAAQKFPDQKLLPELAPWLIKALTPHVKTAVESDGLCADLAVDTVRKLIHDLLVMNCRESYDLEQKVCQSNVWLHLLSIAEQAKIVAATPGVGTQRQRAFRRQTLVNPILARKGWKLGTWASKAGVHKDCVSEFLNGTTEYLTEEIRESLAGALEIKSEYLY